MANNGKIKASRGFLGRAWDAVFRRRVLTASEQADKSLLRRVAESLIERRNGNELVFLAIGVMIGVVTSQVITLLSTALGDFLYSLAPEAVGIVFTVLVLNRFDQIREDRQTREHLIRQMHSRYNQFALQAIEELRVLGWLSDGKLAGQDMRGSNWRDANLYQANLTGCDLQRVLLDDADLYEANLTGVKIKPEQLKRTKTMRYAIMPDGQKYDGRYNLPHDIELMFDPRFKTDPNNPEQIAAFYGVDVESYLRGQEPEIADRPFEI
jgi:hypothetical protein